MSAPTGPGATVTLRGGVEIPMLGFGVFRTPARLTAAAVRAALQAGYRHIDTAITYGNEADVAAGIRASGLDPAQVFITTKLGNGDHSYVSTLEAFEWSRSRLGVEVIDLYLVHGPVRDRRLLSWRAVEHLLEVGKVRAIGVSNCTVRELEELSSVAESPPVVNQMELNPYNWASRGDVLELCAEMGIAVEACSPLTRGRRLGDPLLLALAKLHGKSTAQILIRWALQRGLIVLPKSADIDRITANADVFDFALDDQHMQFLDALNEAS